MTDKTRRLIKGGAWNVAANIAKISSSLVVLPILTRLLSADDFGLVQMAMPVIIFTMVFNTAGLGPALVVADEPSDELWSSALWANFGIGLAFTLVLIATAPLMGLFYRSSEVVPVIIALSSAILLQTAAIIPGAWLQREFNFRSLAVADILGNGLGVLTAVVAAWIGFGVWSLVIQQIVIQLVRSAYLWVVASPPILLMFSWAELKKITNFSLNVNFASVANFFGRNADNIILGRAVGATALGFYSIAYRLMLLPIQVFSWGMATILLPGLSQMKYERERLQSACMRVFQMVSVVTFPIMAGACALSEPLVVTVLGEQMRPAAPLLAILAPVGAMQSLSSSHGSIFLSLGRADIMFRWSVICNILIVIAFLIGINWGVAGLAWSYLIMNLLLGPPGYALLFRQMGLRWGRFFAGVGPISLSAIGMGLIVWFCSRELAAAGFSELQIVLIGIPLGAVLYAVAIFVLSRAVLDDLISLVRQMLSRKPAAELSAPEHV